MYLLYIQLLCLGCFANIAFGGSCQDFTESACELSENNIVGHNRNTATPGACQGRCVGQAGCDWFTHFDTQCYLLSQCGKAESCGGCTSGPTSPEFSSCPWPPVPTTSNAPTTASTTSASTSTTTHSSTTDSQCVDMKANEKCDWTFGLIQWYDSIQTGGECQHACRNVNNAVFFSHYLEAGTGHCGCFSTCAWPSPDGCVEDCSDDTPYCHCMRGPLTPDAGLCNFWPTIA